MKLIEQNAFPIALTNRWLGASHATYTVLASLWMNNMEIAVCIGICIFTPVKKQGIPSF